MKTFFLFLLLLTSLWAKPTYTIAILSDGKTQNSDKLETALKDEISQLLGRDYNVIFPTHLHKNGDWEYLTIAENINLALHDNRSDMIITLGVLSSHYISRKSSYSKPVIATVVIDPKMQKVPYKDGTSGKSNLTYVSAHQTLNEDIETINEIMPVKKISVLIDEVLLTNTPEIGRYINRKFKKKNIEVELVPLGKNIKDDLDKISDDVDIVYVTPLFQQTKAEKKVIYERLIAKELPSFAAAGKDDVELGALFGNAPSTDIKRFIRQVSLDVQQVVLGTNASEQSVNFIPNPAFSINMKTANEISYTPSWELLSKATIIKSEQSDSHFFNIEEIMNRAISHNLNIIASTHQIELSQADVDQAKSHFLPQVYLGAEAAKIDEDRAIASFGLYNEARMDVYMNFSQELLNQQASAKVSVNKNFLKAQNSATDFVKLDTGLAVAINYLYILQLRTKLEIEKSNLELSKTNMRSAISKNNIGLGNTSDIYRWQTKIADEKKSVLFTHTALQQAKHTLNSLLDLPQELPLNFELIDMDNEVFMTSHEEMKSYFLDQTKFSKFQSFLIETAKSNMPSIHQYDALESARKLIVESNDDAFYIPNITVEGGLREHFVNASNETRDKDTSGKYDDLTYADNTDWEIGVFLRFPLYQGGAKTAALQASQAALLMAQAQRKNLMNEVEKNVRNALYQAKASYLSIKLAESASISSKKHLQLIKDVYAQGNIGIIDLLDAQHTALRSALLENNTRYSFMKDLLVLQHDIGQVNFNMDDNTWSEWYTNLQNNSTIEED
jgi:outer membrane protein